MSDNLILGDEKMIFTSEKKILAPLKEYDGQKFELILSKLINIHLSAPHLLILIFVQT